MSGISTRWNQRVFSKMKLVQMSLITRNHSILRGFCLVSIYHDIERRICFRFFAALISNRFSQNGRSYTSYHNFASNWNLSGTRSLPTSCVASVNLCFLHRLTFHFISPLNCMPRLSMYAHRYTYNIGVNLRELHEYVNVCRVTFMDIYLTYLSRSGNRFNRSDWMSPRTNRPNRRLC